MGECLPGESNNTIRNRRPLTMACITRQRPASLM
jgi:hypothetical protein